MGEARRHLDLAQEPLGADLGRDLGPEDLEGDLAVVAQVAGQEHHRHAALRPARARAHSGRRGRFRGVAGVRTWVHKMPSGMGRC